MSTAYKHLPINEVGGQDIFTKEPVCYCPKCNTQVHAEFVDNGFGPYAIQCEPYHCTECGWIEGKGEQW